MKKIHSIVKKLFLTILIFNVLLIFFFLAKNNKTFLTYSIYFFFILWGLDKYRSWLMNDDIRIGPTVKISKEAPKYIRFLGLLFSLFLIIFGSIKLTTLLFNS